MSLTKDPQCGDVSCGDCGKSWPKIWAEKRGLVDGSDCIEAECPSNVDEDFSDVLSQYMAEENLHRFEGRRGVETLCQVARAIGYKDPQYFGQLTSKAVVGDLIMMLEDNSGLVEAMIEWLGNQNSPEWKAALQGE